MKLEKPLRRSRAAPTDAERISFGDWAGWLSVVVGILAIGSIAFFPQFVFLLWILIVSLVMFLRPASTTRSG
jgi:hypothetical protein